MGSDKCCAERGLTLQVKSVANEIQRAKMHLRKPCEIKENACMKRQFQSVSQCFFILDHY